MAESSRGEQTRNIIRQAITRIEKGRPKVVIKERKMSVAAVAEEAGVSRATIHNNYPDMADRIRTILGKQNQNHWGGMGMCRLRIPHETH